jgi:hypothetical protein
VNDKLFELPCGLYTYTPVEPVLTWLGTRTVMEVAEVERIVPLKPVNITALASDKFVPVMVTVLPTGPELGDMEVMLGGEVEGGILMLTGIPVLTTRFMLMLPGEGMKTAYSLVYPLRLVEFNAHIPCTVA